MIFCSVGTQAPFERMLSYLSEWSHANPHIPIVAQVGNDERDLGHISAFKTIAEPFFSENFNASTVVVSHAGMGNIIRSLELGKPIVIVPRDSSRGEHINNHQYDTVENFSGFSSVFIAHDKDEFFSAIDSALNYSNAEIPLDFTERDRLISYVKSFAS
ncbi:glycosyltransferase [Pseudomonas mandelii]|uniref:glycosyltransferase n=1 Tax=Pseudomonas mandelii TaxID=75612 RepID=UPI000382818F|nr:glycosyltransferase [Pseudomonas mandelii]